MRLFELQDRPEQDKNFDRNIMPQIRKGNLQNSPFKFKKGKIRLDKLKPVQSQRVKGMHDKAKQGFADGSIRPIVIDKNNYIVNGHHRYDVARGLELKKVRVLKVDASIEDLIDHFTDTASPEPTYEQIMKAKLDSLMETIEASQDISALMKGIEADLKQREKDLKRLPKKSVYEAPIIRPQDSYDPDANDAYNTATNRRPPKYDYDPEMDYRPGKSLGKIPNIQSETEVVQMPNGDLYLFYANSMSASSRETPRQKSMWQKAISWLLQNPKANQTGPNKEKNVIGFLKLKPFEDGYRVSGVGMDPEIRGQGKAIKFYLAFSAWKGVPIYSDFTQTPSAKTMWNSIMARYPKRVVAYDQKTKKDISLAKAGEMYQDQPDGFDKMNQHKAAKVLGGTKLFKLLPESGMGMNQQYPEITQSKAEEIISEWEWQENVIKIGNGMLIIPAQKEDGTMHMRPDPLRPGEYIPYNINDILLLDKNKNVLDFDDDIEDLLNNNFAIIQAENFADGKKKGKSRPGRVKKSGASCNGSVTSLRKKAKNSSGEKSKMYHWCANMKAGKKKS